MNKEPKAQKSWQEKLYKEQGLPKVEVITDKMSHRWGTGTVVVPAPREVDEIMKTVLYGKLITIDIIRSRLAKKHGATIGCPLTTGIFAWVAAHAAGEAAAAGVQNTTPYWRTLKSRGVMNEKYLGGVEGQKKLLEAEGHKVVQKGKKHIVVDFEEHLIDD